MKRYLAFKGFVDTGMGWDHFIGDFDTIPDAIDACSPIEEWWSAHVVDTSPKPPLIVWEG